MAFVSDPEVPTKIDSRNLTDNLRALGEELSGDTSDIMACCLEEPSGVSDEDFRRLARKAKKKVKEIGDDTGPLKEGPSFLGHIASKIRKTKATE